MKERQSGLGNDEKFLMLHKEYQKLDKKLEDIARTVEQNQLEDCFYNTMISVSSMKRVSLPDGRRLYSIKSIQPHAELGQNQRREDAPTTLLRRVSI